MTSPAAAGPHFPETALIRYTLRAYLDGGLSPRRALHAGAAMLDRQLQGSLATVVLAVFRPAARTLAYACAGHPPPIVTGARSIEPVLEGVARRRSECAPRPGCARPRWRFQDARRSAFFTDGLVEARVAGELFGVERGLTDLLDQLGASASAEALLARLVAHSDRGDPMTWPPAC